jgi:hypothetical protein
MFSRNTIYEALDPLTRKTNADIEAFALRYGLERYLEGDSKRAKVNALVRHLIDLNQQNPTVVDEIVKDLVSEYLREIKSSLNPWEDDDDSRFAKEFPRLSRSLERDGFTVVNYELKMQFPKSVSVVKNEDEVFSLLDKHGFTIPRKHLEQAIEAHANGRWEAANGQLRAFLEGLFDEMADKIYGSDAKNQPSTVKRDWLGRTNPPLFDPNLNEIANDGKNFINGLFKRLHPAGPHAGSSDSEDSTFRLHLVLFSASYYLRKFDRGIQKP